MTSHISAKRRLLLFLLGLCLSPGLTGTVRADGAGQSITTEVADEAVDEPPTCDNSNPQPSADGQSMAVQSPAKGQSLIGGGSAQPSGMCGYQIALWTGEERYQRIDLVVPGLFPIRLQRIYRSNSDYDSPLGHGWGFSYDLQIYERDLTGGDTEVVLRSGAGRRDRYLIQAAGPAHQGPKGGRVPIVIEEVDGYLVRYHNGIRAKFDTAGKLDYLENGLGHRLYFTYRTGKYALEGTSHRAVDPTSTQIVAYRHQVEKIEEVIKGGQAKGDSGNRHVSFDYDASTGRLIRATSHDGRVVEYDHDGLGNLTAVRHLMNASGTEEIVATYRYDGKCLDGTSTCGDNGGDAHNLTLSQEGDGTQEIVRTYDSEDRVTLEEFGTGSITFDYSPNAQDPNERLAVEAIVPDQGTTRYRASRFVFTDAGLVESLTEEERTGTSPSFTFTPIVETKYIRTSEDGFVDRVEVYSEGSSQAQKITRYEYDSAGFLDAIETDLRDPDDYQTILETVRTEYDYHTDGQLEGEIWTTSVEIDHEVNPATHPFKTITTYEEDAEGLPIGVSEIKRFTDGNVANALVTTHHWDTAQTQIEKIELPDGHEIGLEYYAKNDAVPGQRGRLKKRCHLSGTSCIDEDWVEFEYNAAGYVSKITRPLRSGVDTTTHLTYDRLGRVTSLLVIDDEGGASEAELLNRDFEYGDPDSARSPAYVHGHNLRRIITGPSAGTRKAEEFVYYENGALSEILRGEQGSTLDTTVTFTTDSRAMRTSQEVERLIGTDTTATAVSQRLVLDVLGRVESVVEENPSGDLTTLELTYDASNVATATDALDRTTTYTHDELDRLILIEDPVETGTVSGETAFEYDAMGNVVAVVGPRTDVTGRTEYVYDLLSRIHQVVRNPGASAWVQEYEYDDRGRLEHFTNARGEANGASEVDYTYLAWGPLEKLIYCGDTSCTAGSASRTITHGYDDAGNLASVHDTALPPEQETQTYAMTSDGLGRQVEVRVNYLDGTRVLEYAYDAYGNLEQFDFDDDGTSLPLYYGYDARNRLNRMSTISGLTTSPYLDFTYGPDDALRDIRWPNDTTTLDGYRHNERGFIESIDWPGSQGISYAATGAYLDDGSLAEFTETYDSQSYTYEFEYDALGRLTDPTYPTSTTPPGWPSPAPSETFTYDEAGNRTGTDYGHGIIDEMTESPDWDPIVYDEDGNMTSRTVSGGTTEQEFTWDRLSRLVAFDSDTGTTASYVYDVFGRRVKKSVTVSSTTTITAYLWSGDQLIAEYEDPTASPTRELRYVYGGGFAPLQVRLPAGGSTETVYRVHADHLDTPRMATDSSGTPVWHASYEAFGLAHLDPDPDGDANSANNLSLNVRFPGQYFDSESGLHYNRFRYYDPSSGEYVSADPIGRFGFLGAPGAQVASGGNLFDYALDSPAHLIDPNGLTVLKVGKVLSGGAGGGGQSQVAIVADTTGNVGVAVTTSAGAHFGASLSTGGVVGASTAETIFDEAGSSIIQGASAGPQGRSLGLDLVGFNVDDLGLEIQYAASVGTPEAHFHLGNTQVELLFNVKDELRKLLEHLRNALGQRPQDSICPIP